MCSLSLHPCPQKPAVCFSSLWTGLLWTSRVCGLMLPVAFRGAHCGRCQRLILLYGWILVCWADTPLDWCICPLPWWTWGLSPPYGCCKECCCEHLCAGICWRACFQQGEGLHLRGELLAPIVILHLTFGGNAKPVPEQTLETSNNIYLHSHTWMPTGRLASSRKQPCLELAFSQTQLRGRSEQRPEWGSALSRGLKRRASICVWHRKVGSSSPLESVAANGQQPAVEGVLWILLEKMPGFAGNRRRKALVWPGLDISSVSTQMLIYVFIVPTLHFSRGSQSKLGVHPVFRVQYIFTFT